jgi:ubiquinone/menaquinone biosynthesis C-methylase UbiE
MHRPNNKFHKPKYTQNIKPSTSWEVVSKRYNELVGSTGQYFHEKIIIPKSLKLLDLNKDSSLLDLGCGQGILSRYIPKTCIYNGVDLSPSLIQFAKSHNKEKLFSFTVSDITKPLNISKKTFSHASIILALQNVEDMDAVIKNAADHLEENGKFLIVLNHPCFRIPRQSSWEIDDKNKIQYRRLNRYYSTLKIPIDMTPGGREEKKLTWSFHNPIEKYSESLQKNGFLIAKIEEWVSDKNSVGKAAKMENRARDEFPMFMAVLAVKIKM